MIPVTSCPRPWIVRPVGTESSTSRESTCDFAAVWTSTTGDAPVTVSVSSSDPTLSSPLIVIVKFDGSSSASRFTVAKPVSMNVSV